MREVDFELKAWNRTAQAEFVAEGTLPSLESARCLIERLLQAESVLGKARCPLWVESGHWTKPETSYL
jgi:hypothetical protein